MSYKTTRGCGVTAGCSVCQKNVVARQVHEASAKLDSRNQTWALATPGGSQEASATGQVTTPPPNLGLTAKMHGSQPPPPPTGSQHIHGQDSHPTPPKPGGQKADRLSPGRAEVMSRIIITHCPDARHCPGHFFLDYHM